MAEVQKTTARGGACRCCFGVTLKFGSCYFGDLSSGYVFGHYYVSQEITFDFKLIGVDDFFEANPNIVAA